MVPTVDATDELPDHGEAWRVPWQVVRGAGAELSMRCRGQLVPWELTRAIDIRAGAVIFNYTYRNVGSVPHRAYWCAHPLFKYERDMEIDVGIKPRPVPEGQSSKFFLPPGKADHARLRWRGGPAIELRWEPKVTPYCGVWICNGDLGGYRQVAIEPATGGGDRPDSDEPPPLLGPGQTLVWGLQIISL
jgi:hypothetical protein